MVKLLSGVVVGLIVSALGIYFIQLQLSLSSEGSSPILLGLGGVFIGVGIFCVVKGVLAFKAEKALATETLELISGTTPESGVGANDSILKKNNEMLQEWNKTNDARDKLKVLEVAGAAEEGN